MAGLATASIAPKALDAGRTCARRYLVRAALATVLASFLVLAPAAASSIEDRASAASPVVANELIRQVGQLGGQSYAVDVVGEIAYLGQGPRLLALDVSNPTAPRPVGQSDVLPGIVADVRTAGSVAFVVLQGEGLQLLDVSRPSSPRALGFLWLGGGNGVAVEDGLAYVAAGRAGLQIVDVRSPVAPRVLGSVWTVSSARAVDVENGIALVAAGDAGLHIVDATNPTAARTVGVFLPGMETWAVHADAGLAYVADVDGLHVVDIKDPSSPHEVGTLLADWEAGIYLYASYDMTVVGGHGYFVGESNVLGIVDVGDPRHPRWVTSVSLSGDFPRSVAVSGGHAFVAHDLRGMYVVDLSDVGEPRQVGAYAIGSGAFETLAVSSSSGTAFVNEDREHGVHAIDVSDPSQPAWLGRYDHSVDTVDLDAVGTTVYATSSWFDGGLLAILDASRPSRLREVGRIELDGDAESVAADGDYAYVGIRDSGLRVVDVSNPAAPAIVGTLEASWTARELVAEGPFVYAAARDFTVIDVRDALAPVVVGQWVMPYWATAIDVQWPFAYVGYADGSLMVLDISDPSGQRPTGVAYYKAPHAIVGIAVIGEYLWIACTDDTVHLLDVSNPRLPKLLGTADAPGGAMDAGALGDVAWVATERGGLQAFAVDDSRRLLPGQVRSRAYLPLVMAPRAPVAPALKRDRGDDFDGGTFEPYWTYGGELQASLLRTYYDYDEIALPASEYSALLGQPELGDGLSANIPAGSAWIEHRTRVGTEGGSGLTFKHRIVSYDVAYGSSGRVWDTLDVTVNGQLVYRAGKGPADGPQGQRADLGWLSGIVDLSPWRGQVVDIRFAIHNRSYENRATDLYNTWAYLDWVYFTNTYDP